MGSDCSELSLVPEGAPAHARAALAALAQSVSVVAEGDVDTEVVVIAEALVGSGRGDQSVDGGRTGGRVLAPVEAEDAGVVGWLRVC